MDRLLPTVIALVLSTAPEPALAAEASPFRHRAVVVTTEAVAATAAAVGTTLLTSGLILAVGLESPFRSPVSFALLALLPPTAAALAAWGVGLLEPGFDRSWRVALLGAGAGALVAMGGVAWFFSSDSPSPGIPLAYALGILVAGTPVLSAIGATVALELFGRAPLQAAWVPAFTNRGSPMLTFGGAW